MEGFSEPLDCPSYARCSSESIEGNPRPLRRGEVSILNWDVVLVLKVSVGGCSGNEKKAIIINMLGNKYYYIANNYNY
jgi:hypothetical protein